MATPNETWRSSGKTESRRDRGLEQADEERSTAFGKKLRSVHLAPVPPPGMPPPVSLRRREQKFLRKSRRPVRSAPLSGTNECVFDLNHGSLADAWENFVPRVGEITSSHPEFSEKVPLCTIINLCLWCPAHAYLEHRRLDAWSDYFCKVAHARAAAIRPDRV